MVVADSQLGRARVIVPRPATWTGAYLRRAVMADGACAFAAGLLAYEIRSNGHYYPSAVYLAFTFALPLLWCVVVALAGGYNARFIGVGSDEFRKVLNAAVGLAATVAISSYAIKFNFARGCVLIALPCVTIFDLGVRYRLRKRLHKISSQGAYMRRVVAIGHAHRSLTSSPNYAGRATMACQWSVPASRAGPCCASSQESPCSAAGQRDVNREPTRGRYRGRARLPRNERHPAA